MGAEVAVDLVLSQTGGGLALDDSFVESASDVVHAKWLDRNGEWAPESQKKPYAELTEDEKEKDRFFVRAAIDAYNA